MAFADVALGQIKSLRQTAIPRNYEIWYVYATGYNGPLNKIINETLARNGKLTEADLEQIYETYLSQIKTSDRIDKVGARVIGEIDDVMTLISDALVMSASYDASLDGASQKLSVAENRDQVKVIVETLVKSTREMRDTNKALEDRLSLSKTEISNLQHSLEAIRAEMAKELKKKSTGEILGRVTISVGVSMLKPGDDTDALIERADACLYAAKRNGRNHVICEVDPEYTAESHGQVA